MMLNDSLQVTSQYTSSRTYWLCQLGGWGFYAATQAASAALTLNVPWARAAIEAGVLNGLGLIFTHQLHAYILRHQWSSYNLLKLAPRVVAASLALGLPLGLLSQFTSIAGLQNVEPLIHELTPNLQLRLGPVIRVSLQWANWATLLAIWHVIYFVMVSIRQRRSAELRQSELARALQQAELRLLKSQLNPHFLFNALNTVRALIAENPRAAQTAVTRFANTLRYALNAGQHEMVPLSTELEVVMDYLEIESLRLEERLSVEYNLSDAAVAVRIPVMLLQTLVENAIKHGIAHLSRGGFVKIDGTVEEGMLLLAVVNSRPAGAAQLGQGTGLRNAAERLRLIFGPRASVALDLSQPDTATARLRIPVQA